MDEDDNSNNDDEVDTEDPWGEHEERSYSKFDFNYTVAFITKTKDKTELLRFRDKNGNTLLHLFLQSKDVSLAQFKKLVHLIGNDVTKTLLQQIASYDWDCLSLALYYLNNDISNYIATILGEMVQAWIKSLYRRYRVFWQLHFIKIPIQFFKGLSPEELLTVLENGMDHMDPAIRLATHRVCQNLFGFFDSMENPALAIPTSRKQRNLLHFAFLYGNAMSLSLVIRLFGPRLLDACRMKDKDNKTPLEAAFRDAYPQTLTTLLDTLGAKNLILLINECKHNVKSLLFKNCEASREIVCWFIVDEIPAIDPVKQSDLVAFLETNAEYLRRARTAFKTKRQEQLGPLTKLAAEAIKKHRHHPALFKKLCVTELPSELIEIYPDIEIENPCKIFIRTIKKILDKYLFENKALHIIYQILRQTPETQATDELEKQITTFRDKFFLDLIKAHLSDHPYNNINKLLRNMDEEFKKDEPERKAFAKEYADIKYTLVAILKQYYDSKTEFEKKHGDDKLTLTWAPNPMFR